MRKHHVFHTLHAYIQIPTSFCIVPGRRCVFSYRLSSPFNESLFCNWGEGGKIFNWALSTLTFPGSICKKNPHSIHVYWTICWAGTCFNASGVSLFIVQWDVLLYWLLSQEKHVMIKSNRADVLHGDGHRWVIKTDKIPSLEDQRHLNVSCLHSDLIIITALLFGDLSEVSLWLCAFQPTTKFYIYLCIQPWLRPSALNRMLYRLIQEDKQTVEWPFLCKCCTPALSFWRKKWVSEGVFWG